jgi:hypothetical protein
LVCRERSLTWLQAADSITPPEGSLL